jgi:ABC-type phosphate/phosphonate transport system permease subunit
MRRLLPSTMMLPWLFPLALLLVVLVVAFAPGPVAIVLAVIAFVGLSYIGVLYYQWYLQRQRDGNADR